MAIWSALSLMAAGVLTMVFQPARADGAAAPPLPSDPRAWIGAPQSWEALRGRVVLLDVWTFG